jgi:Bacteriophage head to tail connecting protein
MDVSARQRSLDYLQALDQERSSWTPQYRELAEYLAPRLGRFLVSDTNKGHKKHQKIIDSTGTRSVRMQSAGLLGGASSPARPWFRLATPDPKLNRVHDVQVWLAECTRIMLSIFSKSNTYRMLHSLYDELGVFGTGVSILTADFNTVIHNHAQTCGQYWLASNWRGDVDTLYREMQRPVAAVVREFGLGAVSDTVRNMYTSGKYDAPVVIVHAIEPRTKRDSTKQDVLNMAWRSCYFERGSNEDKYLRESGMRKFRVIAPRWYVTPGDTYGGSAGMDALGDVKQLQQQNLRKSQGIDYQTKPPLQAPLSMLGREIDMLPGGITFTDTNAGGIKSLYDVRLDLNHQTADIQDVRQRVREAFNADVFALLTQRTSTMTATEVAELHEEKLLLLGPVLERLHNELFSPLINLTFDEMIENNLVPPPPPELHGVELNVEFVSMLAQAQRAISTNNMDRYIATLGSLAAIKPGVADKLEADNWADIYGDLLGVDPEIIVGNKEVAIIRQKREQAQAQAAMTAQLEQAASAAQKLGTVQTQAGNSNMVNDMLNQFSGYNSPTAVGL